MITAKFGSKSFEVSSKKIYTPSGLSISEEIDLEETEVKGKKPTLSKKAIKLQGLSFDLKLDCRFVDVAAELRWWKTKLHSNEVSQFILGSFIIGWFVLQKYDIKDIVLDKNGNYISANISLTLLEDGASANKRKLSEYNFTSTKKAEEVKSSATSTATTTSSKVRKGSTIKPKSGVRWYQTAEGAIKKTGKSGKAYQQNLVVTYTYSKSGKIVCVNPKGLGWLKVEDVTVVKY